MALKSSKLAAELKQRESQLESARITLDMAADQIAALHAANERLALADKQWADHVKRLADERDALRAENEWLRRNIPTESVNMNNWQVRYREWREAGMPDESSQS